MYKIKEISFPGLFVIRDSEKNQEIKTINAGLANSDGCKDITHKSNHLVAPFMGVPKKFKYSIIRIQDKKVNKQILLIFFWLRNEHKIIVMIEGTKKIKCLFTK